MSAYQIGKITGNGSTQVITFDNCMLNTAWGYVALPNGDPLDWSSHCKPDSLIHDERYVDRTALKRFAKCFISYNNNYGNYYHILMEWCHALFVYVHQGFYEEGYLALLPGSFLDVNYKQNQLLQSTIDFLNIREKVLYANEISERILIDKCAYPHLLSGAYYLDFSHQQENWFNSLSEHICSANTLTTIPSKKNFLIYISRLDSKKRALENEIELINFLCQKYGAQCLTMSALSLQQQIYFIQSAQYIISPHGAGLANLAFKTSSSCNVIEILPCDYEGFHFKCISDAKGYAHNYIYSSSDKYSATVPSLTIHENKYTVDIEEVSSAIDTLLKQNHR